MLHFCNNFKKFLRFSDFRSYCRATQNLTNRISSIEDMETNLTLYGDYASPPVRFVLVTASLLKIKLNFHDIDLFKSENKSEFYTKINPLQKVPALTVGNNTICDSHAIALYLIQRSGYQELYPIDDLMQKAQVDQMLYFNATTLFPIDSEIYRDYFSGIWPAVESKVENWNKALDYLEMRLKKHEYLVADKMLLCDLCCSQTVMSMSLILPVPASYQRVKEWHKVMENTCSDINQRGLDRFRKMIKDVEPNLG